MTNRLLLVAVVAATSGCATAQRPTSTGRFDRLGDAQLARLAVREVLGELNVVEAVDAQTGEARGVPAFATRDERVSFDAHVARLLGKHLEGEAPLMVQLERRCEARQRRFESPEAVRRSRRCAWVDEAPSLHALFKKPALQREYLELLLLEVEDLAERVDARERFSRLASVTLEPYRFKLEAWEYLEGFRPRG